MRYQTDYGQQMGDGVMILFLNSIEPIWEMALKLCWFFMKFCHGTLFLEKNDMGDVMYLNNRG